MAQVLRPLVYCAYRITDQEGEVSICGNFAGHLLERMPLCTRHNSIMLKGVNDEDIEWIDWRQLRLLEEDGRPMGELLYGED